MLYEILKSLHIISVICWFAGLFYLPRLFVYHTQAAAKGEASETFKTMERKLFWYIMFPALKATWIFGLWMLWEMPTWLEDGWMHAKITCVVLLTAYHMVLKKHMKQFQNDENVKSEKYYRILNEAPTLLLVVIVFLVVLKPF